MNILEVKDLVKKFDDKTVVNGISFNIKEGEVYGLLGPNGAGKSTTINMIISLLKKNNGSIKVLGLNQDEKIDEFKSYIGYVPQDLAIYESLSVYDNLEFFGTLYGLKGENLKKRIKEVTELVGLTDRINDKSAYFSGGMKRRLNIACALLHNPKLLIMDEPTVGIDPQSRNNILESIAKLNKEGMSILYTTHYMVEAEKLCDRVGIIDNGMIIAEGTVSDLEKLVNEFNYLNLDVLAKEKITEEKIKSIFSNVSGINNISLIDEGLVFEITKETSVIRNILDILNKNEIEVANIVTKNPNLEDVFLKFTGKKLRE